MDREAFLKSDLYKEIRRICGYLAWNGNIGVKDGKFVTLNYDNTVTWTYDGEVKFDPEIGWMPIEWDDDTLHYGDIITSVHC